MAKGAAQWLSWVLLLFFAVILSMIMFSWISGYAKERSEQLIQVTDTDECESVGLKLEGCQNTQALYINTTNIHILPVQSILFRIFDIYYNVETKQQNVSIKPGETKAVTVLKVSMTKMLEVVPILWKDNREIICRKRMVTLEEIPVC